MAGDLIIACVQQGNYLGRGAEYVNKLFDMVRRNISNKVAYKFICFTDDDDGLDCDIEVRSLPLGVKGWWNKLYLFKELTQERVIYFDLDTVICGGLDDLIKYDRSFAMLSDFYNPQNIAGGVILWQGNFSAIWDKWVLEGKPDYNGNPQEGFGEAYWIQKNGLKPDILQDLFPKQIASYKVHCRSGIPKGTRVICFHGEPRPHQAPESWMQHIWKIGGGTTQELEIVCNTDKEHIIANIHNALEYGHPKLKIIPARNGDAIIVGGAPSLKTELNSLRARKQSGAIIFATNNTYNFLVANDIQPDFHVMLDAREENMDFVPVFGNCYYASQCHPKVFERADSNECSVHIWHAMNDPILEAIGNDTGDALIGGGTSVGLKAIALAHALGYRTFHIYGLDSSYEDTGAHHAYGQSLNDGEHIMDITCNNEKFRCAAWMCTQAEEFKEMAKELVSSGCLMTVHGYGLIPYLCGLLFNSLENNVKYPYNPETERTAHA